MMVHIRETKISPFGEDLIVHLDIADASAPKPGGIDAAKFHLILLATLPKQPPQSMFANLQQEAVKLAQSQLQHVQETLSRTMKS